MEEHSHTTDNPYETPQTRSEVRQLTGECPVCGGDMEHGYLHSSSDIRWVSEDTPKLARFVTGGYRLPFKKKAFSLGRQYHGSFCRRCLLTIIDQD